MKSMIRQSALLKAHFLPALLAATFTLMLAPVASAADEESAEAAQAAEAAAKAAAEAAEAARIAQTYGLENVLAKIREEAAKEARIQEEREAEFRRAMVEQENEYQDALARRNAAEDLSNRLSNQYDENELRIEDMTTLLELHQGNLGELFGVTRQIAGDAAGQLSSSLITTQFPAPPGGENRVDFLRRLAAASELPSIVELERLWLELMKEMTEDAKVLRYTTPVLQLDGSMKDTEVVRIASFTAVGDDKYLTYLPNEEVLGVMTRQPSDEAVMESASDLLDTPPDAGYVSAVVDPARGAIFSLVVERPNFFERIEEGEVVGYLIIAVGIIGVLVALFQYGYLIIARIKVSAQAKRPDKPARNNALGRVLLAVSAEDKEEQEEELPEILELRISEARLREVLKLERFQSFLRLAVAAGPLLGLIGTVIGMIITFESITASGSSDPKLMAQGIGQAMIATVLGLGVAIPLLFINTGLASLSRSVIHILEEQGTRLMARRLEERDAH